MIHRHTVSFDLLWCNFSKTRPQKGSAANSRLTFSKIIPTSKQGRNLNESPRRKNWNFENSSFWKFNNPNCSEFDESKLWESKNPSSRIQESKLWESKNPSSRIQAFRIQESKLENPRIQALRIQESKLREFKVGFETFLRIQARIQEVGFMRFSRIQDRIQESKLQNPRVRFCSGSESKQNPRLWESEKDENPSRRAKSAIPWGIVFRSQPAEWSVDNNYTARVHVHVSLLTRFTL